MKKQFIVINEYCQKSHIDPTFILSLAQYGLIDLPTIQGELCLHYSQLQAVECYSHLHYDLSINFEGIDAIRHLLQRIESLQQELEQLRRTHPKVQQSYF